VRAVFGNPTPLVSAFNRPGDTGKQTATYTLDPGPQGEGAAIKKLLAQDAAYGDDLPYELFPGSDAAPSGDTYNSNSYTAGMLKAAGIQMPEMPYNTPGLDKPVPEEQFQ
jgi:hypothetical protein